MTPARYSVFWTNNAQRDLENVIDYIALHSRSNAVNVFNRIRRKAEELMKFPLRGRVVSELQFCNIESYREIILSPWRVIYKTDFDKVYVIAVFDGRRNFEDILLERLLKE